MGVDLAASPKVSRVHFCGRQKVFACLECRSMPPQEKEDWKEEKRNKGLKLHSLQTTSLKQYVEFAVVNP